MGWRATAGVELDVKPGGGRGEELGGVHTGQGAGAEHPLPAQPHTSLLLEVTGRDLEAQKDPPLVCGCTFLCGSCRNTQPPLDPQLFLHLYNGGDHSFCICKMGLSS